MSTHTFNLEEIKLRWHKLRECCPQGKSIPISRREIDEAITYIELSEACDTFFNNAAGTEVCQEAFKTIRRILGMPTMGVAKPSKKAKA